MASPDLNIGPNNGPTQPISTSRALTRVTPVLPRPVTEANPSPVGRGGVGAQELLLEPDELVVRSRTPAIALDVGLEAARGAFVRNQPADALTLLDAVWEGASKLETGWYLRSGSLALLGLPGEAEKLARHALGFLPQSVALRFVQSLVRLSAGDVAGARAALASVLGKSSNDILLQVHDALLLARQGDAVGGERALRQAIVQSPDHPAVAWGRTVMSEAVRDGEHLAGATVDNDGQKMRTPPRSATPPYVSAVGSAGQSTEIPLSGDVLVDALRRFGARLGSLPVEKAVAECRALIVSLSAGGPLAAMTSSSRAFAARALLSAMVDALQGGRMSGLVGSDGEAFSNRLHPDEAFSSHLGSEADRGSRLGSESRGETLQRTVRDVIAALRDGRSNELERLLGRSPAAVDATSLSLLRALCGRDGNRGTPGSSGVIDGRMFDATPSANADADATAALPFRLGLALLPANEAARRSGDWRAISARSHETDPSVTWTGAGFVSTRQSIGGERPTSARLISFLLVALAAVALYNAHAVVAAAAAFGAVAVWSRRVGSGHSARSIERNARD